MTTIILGRIFRAALGAAVLLTFAIAFLWATPIWRQNIQLGLRLAGLAYLIATVLFVSQDRVELRTGAVSAGCTAILARIFLSPTLSRIPTQLFLTNITRNPAQMVILPFFCGMTYYLVGRFVLHHYFTR